MDQNWYLHLDTDAGGKKTGPFPLDQILGLFADGEIPPTARVSGAATHETIAVSELARRQAQPNAVGTGPRTPKPFTPPPRPADLVPPPPVTATEVTATPQADPALGLFDALQAAKERKQHAAAKKASLSGARAILTQSKGQLKERLSEVPHKTWLILGIALLLIASAWGLAYALKGRTPKEPAVSSEKAAAPNSPSTETPPAGLAAPSGSSGPAGPAVGSPAMPMTPAQGTSPGAIRRGAQPNGAAQPQAAPAYNPYNNGGGASYQGDDDLPPPPPLPEPPMPADYPPPPPGGDFGNGPYPGGAYPNEPLPPPMGGDPMGMSPDGNAPPPPPPPGPLE